MKNLIIIGAGGFGREAADAAIQAIGYQTEFCLKGFLDARPEALAGYASLPPIIGTPEDYVPQADDVFFCALGNLAARRRCVQLVKAKGAKFQSIIDKTARIGSRTHLGEGVFVASGVSITVDCSVGDFTCIFHNSSIGHNVQIGAYSHVYALVSIGGDVQIGEEVSIYPGSVIVPRRKIGKCAVVGAGSSVFLSVPEACRVMGNPAEPVD